MYEGPLCVDLDGTLLKTDTLLEAFLLLIKQSPGVIFLLPFWLLGGKARLKHEISRRVTLNAAVLPVNENFLEFLREEYRRGRALYLVTGANRKIGEAVAAHYQIFKEVLASDESVNLTGRKKAALLEQRFGPKEFAYAGNSHVDLPVWAAARQTLVVNAGASVLRAAETLGPVERVFDQKRFTFKTVSRLLRVHQWTKNFLLFAPLAGAHHLFDPVRLVKAALAFGAFCLCASSVYILNDLLDLDSDRQHSYKRNRPFASGMAPISVGLVAAPLLLICGFALAFQLSAAFLAAFAVYYLMTLLYSFWLKQLVILDVLVLAGLYTIRVIAGGLATQVVLSDWLMVFSMFIFISLAFAKRFTELQVAVLQNKENLKGRGYRIEDLDIVSMMGVGSGYLAVLVIAFYVNNPVVAELYHCPKLLWLVCPVLLYWISRVWLLAHRKQLHDDPIVFALKDRQSWLICGLALVIALLATLL